MAAIEGFPIPSELAWAVAMSIIFDTRSGSDISPSAFTSPAERKKERLKRKPPLMSVVFTMRIQSDCNANLLIFLELI
jgi:hypothetical protein